MPTTCPGAVPVDITGSVGGFAGSAFKLFGVTRILRGAAAAAVTNPELSQATS
jgi:hypothetical protein